VTFVPPTPPPSAFKLGDRVATPDKPKDCGTIIGIVKQDAAGTLFKILWDDHGQGDLADAALIKCQA
jgi:hypothetical protein